MFITRTISGVILLAITMCAIMASGPLLYVFMLLISLVGMFELYRVFKMEKHPITVICYLTVIGINSVILAGKTSAVIMVLAAGFLTLMAFYVAVYPKINVEEVVKGCFGILYVGLMLSFLFALRMAKDGAYTVWLAFISAWGCDTCAYLTGITLGKHKLTPVLSPKKSVEGAIGGILGSLLLGALYGFVFQEKISGFQNPALVYGVICACGAVISMFGDLSASAIKRNYGIKDYGTLIPGHGGILDRFDSIVFTAPLIYMLSQLFQTVL